MGAGCGTQTPGTNAFVSQASFNSQDNGGGNSYTFAPGANFYGTVDPTWCPMQPNCLETFTFPPHKRDGSYAGRLLQEYIVEKAADVFRTSDLDGTESTRLSSARHNIVALQTPSTAGSPVQHPLIYTANSLSPFARFPTLTS